MLNVLDSIQEWMMEVLRECIISNLSGLFDQINTEVGEVAANVGTTPAAWNAGVFSMIRNLSDNVVVPIAGMVITFVLCYELITMLVERNNFHDFESFALFKWVFKACVAVYLVTNTFNITMAVFDLAQTVVQRSAGIITSSTSVDFAAAIGDVAAEQETFRSWLLDQSPVEILNHAFEYSAREDILMEMEGLALTAPLAAALSESPCPMADVFKDFCDMETSHMDNIRACIEGRAEHLLEAHWKETRAIPLYRHDSTYAAEHGEGRAFRISRRTNFACRNAIETLLLDISSKTPLSSAAVKDVLTEFGPERVAYVLAVSLLEKKGDRHFSQSNMEWASSVPMSGMEGSALCSCTLYSDLCDLNSFVTLARKEMAAMLEPPEKKPSIKEQLSAGLDSGKQPAAKRKDREVR